MDPRYIFTVQCKTLIHGGPGHRPLLLEEWIHCKSYLGLIAYIFLSHLFWYGKALALVFLYLILAMSSAKNQSVTMSNPNPFSPLKHSLLHTSVVLNRI
jgi:hypothetical protein